MFKLKKSTDGQFYFVLCAKNHKTLLTSETYKRKENAVKGVIAVLNVFTPNLTDAKIKKLFKDETSTTGGRKKH